MERGDSRLERQMTQEIATLPKQEKYLTCKECRKQDEYPTGLLNCQSWCTDCKEFTLHLAEVRTIRTSGVRTPQVGGGGTPKDDERHVHVRFKTQGNKLKRKFFNFLVGSIDPDYPEAPQEVRRSSAPAVKTCGKCKGLVWRLPMLEEAELRILSTQVNKLTELPGHFRLKIKLFEDAEKCEKSSGPLVEAV